MIDWPSMVVNTFWIIGLAVSLAAVSFYYWQAEGVLRRMCRDAAFQSYFAAGVGLCGLGIAGGADSWWLRGLWGALALLAFGQGWEASRSWRKAK
jgi:hypothetical protein